MSQNDLLLPATIPAYAMTSASPEALADIFADAMGGLSLGRNPQIRVKQGKWRLIDRDGTETPIKPNELVDGEFLPLIILRAKRALSKVYYSGAYDPAAEAQAPDCSSEDSVCPDSNIAEPMSKSCATCPMNAFGSGRNANGAPTKGKACTDTKVLAVFYKGGIYEFKVNPASLQNIAAYFGALQERRVSPGAVLTYVGLDEKVEFTKMTFKAGAFLPEQHIPTIAQKAVSSEAEAIINPRRTAAPAPVAAPAPAKTATKAAPVQAPAPVEEPAFDPLAGMGLDEAEVVAAPAPAPAAKKAAAAPKLTKVPDPAPAAAAGLMGDDDIADLLSL